MIDSFPVAIYHNPQCGTSRNVLAMIQAAGYVPKVIPYLDVGWTRELLVDLASRSGLPLRDLVRERGTSAQAQGLLDPETTDETLLAAMVADPKLVNRPIVSTPKGVALCRPSERVLDLLERTPAAFTKEDGQVVR